MVILSFFHFYVTSNIFVWTCFCYLHPFCPRSYFFHIVSVVLNAEPHQTFFVRVLLNMNRDISSCYYLHCSCIFPINMHYPAQGLNWRSTSNWETRWSKCFVNTKKKIFISEVQTEIHVVIHFLLISLIKPEMLQEQCGFLKNKEEMIYLWNFRKSNKKA